MDFQLTCLLEASQREIVLKVCYHSYKKDTYLGSIESKEAKMDKEIECRIGKPSSVFGNLYHRLWNTHGVLLNVKIDAYKSVVQLS